MKKHLVCLSLAASLGFSHNLWVWGENGDKLSADIIYGHHFPTPEKIKEERVSIFDDIKVISENGEVMLKQTGENYHFEGKKLDNGVYIMLGLYKPTHWIRKADGKWEMNKTRKDTKEKVEFCEVATMQSKAIFVVGDSDSKILKKEIKKGLEITPLFDSVKDFKVGELLKFKLTLDGKPVKKASVYADYAGYSSSGDMANAGYAKTDLDGKFEVRPLKAGLWYLKSSVENDSGDKNCETKNDNTTLIFEVK